MRSLLVLVLLVSGCQNSCQQICGEMASYARQCGYTVPDAQLKACRQQQAGKHSRDDRQICRQAGDGKTIREEWTCDDLAVYWSRVSEPDTGDTAW